MSRPAKKFDFALTSGSVETSTYLIPIDDQDNLKRLPQGTAGPPQGSRRNPAGHHRAPTVPHHPQPSGSPPTAPHGINAVTEHPQGFQEITRGSLTPGHVYSLHGHVHSGHPCITVGVGHTRRLLDLAPYPIYITGATHGICGAIPKIGEGRWRIHPPPM